MVCPICSKITIINCMVLKCHTECGWYDECVSRNSRPHICYCQKHDIIKQLVADKIELETNLETLLNEKTTTI